MHHLPAIVCRAEHCPCGRALPYKITSFVGRQYARLPGGVWFTIHSRIASSSRTACFSYRDHTFRRQQLCQSTGENGRLWAPLPEGRGPVGQTLQPAGSSAFPIARASAQGGRPNGAQLRRKSPGLRHLQMSARFPGWEDWSRARPPHLGWFAHRTGPGVPRQVPDTYETAHGLIEILLSHVLSRTCLWPGYRTACPSKGRRPDFGSDRGLTGPAGSWGGRKPLRMGQFRQSGQGRFGPRPEDRGLARTIASRRLALLIARRRRC
jgi:hypothetical protein